MNSYKAFGLYISSELFFPELAAASFSVPDVIIRRGCVPDELQQPLFCGARYQAAPNEFLLNVETVAKFYVRQGKEIIIESKPGIDEDSVRLFLLGSAMGALLHQRGFFVLHGNAIAINDTCTVVTGHSGAGKSTLAAAFYQQGYRILADDVCAVSMETGVPMVIPGFPQLKIWKDVADKLQLSTEGLRRVRPQVEKYALPTRDSFKHDPLPLSTLCILGCHNGDAIELDAPSGLQKFGVLKEHTYRYHFLRGLGLLSGHLQHMGQLVAAA